MSNTAFDSLKESNNHMLKSFLKADVRIDYPNRKGRTPFLNFYEKQNFELSSQMLDLGANVNQMDNSGLFALKYALIRRQNPAIKKLLDYGANINQIDNKGRNLLHHAINMSSATADATFESEQFLIDHGVDINLKDQKNRTPLHYAFVKIQDWKNKTQIDPIETVSSLCGCKGL
jgi:ankyrin repeat protein